MSQYNYFGLTYQQVVDAFRGAVVNDFGGQALIEQEMDLAEAEIISALSPKALSMLENVSYLQVPELSGNVWAPIQVISSDLTVWQVPKENGNSGWQTIGGSWCNSGGCNNMPTTLGDELIFTDYTLINGAITFGATFNQTDYLYYASYTTDITLLDIPSLKGMLRDRVCCVLGMQLYSKNDDIWGLVTLYCERGEKWLAMLELNEYWLPGEFKKNKYLNSPFTVRSGITSIRVGRS